MLTHANVIIPSWVWVFLEVMIVGGYAIPAILTFILGKIYWSSITDHISRVAMGEWQGIYYSWGDRQIRVLESGNDVWIVDEDLVRSVGMKLDSDLRRKLKISYPGYRDIPDTKYQGFNAKAVIDFLAHKQDNNPEITRLKLWFEREVFFPLTKRKELNYG